LRSRSPRSCSTSIAAWVGVCGVGSRNGAGPGMRAGALACVGAATIGSLSQGDGVGVGALWNIIDAAPAFRSCRNRARGHIPAASRRYDRFPARCAREARNMPGERLAWFRRNRPCRLGYARSSEPRRRYDYPQPSGVRWSYGPARAWDRGNPQDQRKVCGPLGPAPPLTR
jgi:hypothetical protein